jgi:hypothetical protein
VSNSVSDLNESVLLTKKDIKTSFKLLEDYFISFEQVNDINKSRIVIQNNGVLLKEVNDIKGVKELVHLLFIILKVRFTKYEYDFYGYLGESSSNILRSISLFSEEKGNISIEEINNSIYLINKNI